MVELVNTDTGLFLTDGEMSLCLDFSKSKNRLKINSLNGELLVKAAKIKNRAEGLTLFDATAGLGEDSLLLAAAGFNVKLFEYDPFISALLEDGMKRALEDNELNPIVSRMELFKENSITGMKALGITPDVILLDPMFPKRQKSGLIKKKFQLLQKLESPCINESELINAALLIKPKKIVIKRPLNAPFLGNVKPDYSIEGSTIRFDCIVNDIRNPFR